jgi:two-component system, OmpR family, bacitracin resistance sensor histidine kinase BceS
MLKLYVKERSSWILLFTGLQALLVFLAYIDPFISVASMFYYVFLSFIIYILFFFFRYHKETRFYHEMKVLDDELDISRLPEPASSFEKLVADSIVLQTLSFKKKAEEAELTLEQEKDDLLAWIHEVKTPLSALHLMFDRIEDPSLKKELSYEWLRIHLLLDQQLHQRRIPFMEKDIYIEEIELEELIYGEIKNLQSWCIQKGIGLEVDLDVTAVLADAKWLAFIIRQLLTNAVKYSSESDILVKTYLSSDMTLLEIIDSGRGISPRDLPRIFEKGFTSTDFHNDKSATGMGLYLAKKAADSLHIKMDVKSTLGKGTSFTLTFPQRNEFVRITGM